MSGWCLFFLEVAEHASPKLPRAYGEQHTRSFALAVVTALSTDILFIPFQFPIAWTPPAAIGLGGLGGGFNAGAEVTDFVSAR